MFTSLEDSLKTSHDSFRQESESRIHSGPIKNIPSEPGQVGPPVGMTVFLAGFCHVRDLV